MTKVSMKPLVSMCWWRRVVSVGKGVGEGPPTNLSGEGHPEKRCFGEGGIGEVTEDDGEAPHAKDLGKGDADVDADAACRRPKKSRENAPKLIGCIF